MDRIKLPQGFHKAEGQAKGLFPTQRSVKSWKVFWMDGERSNLFPGKKKKLLISFRLWNFPSKRSALGSLASEEREGRERVWNAKRAIPRKMANVWLTFVVDERMGEGLECRTRYARIPTVGGVINYQGM